MNSSIWDLLDKAYMADEVMAGKRMTRATEVPPESEIQAAEQAIGCEFDSDYVRFLERYGAGIVGSLPVFGLRPVEMMGNRWSVVEITREFREQGWPGTQTWCVISEDGFGNPIGIAQDGQVMIADHDAGSVDIIAPSFHEFLMKQCP
jgi:hypothetical protein